MGRDRHLEVLDAEVGRSMAGGFRVMLVTGAAGLGKTRLIEEALDHHARDAICLSARSYRWGAASSFGPWAEALDRGLRGRPEDELRAVCGPSLHELGALLTAFAAIAGASDPPPRRERLLTALVDLFDGLTADSPVLIALDDLHLADASSWEALRYLARRLPDAPLCVLATARPAELQDLPIAAEVLLGLEEDRSLTRLPLEPLSSAQVTELAHALLRSERRGRSSFVPEPLVTWLTQRSLGHPLFVIGLLRALLEEDADLVAPRLERLPTGLRDRIALDLRGLAPDERHLLEVLAVSDRRTDLADLRRLVAATPEALMVALETLARARLISEHRDRNGLAYELVHPLVQDAVYQGIGGARRRALHRQIGRRSLESGNLGAAAGHFAQAAEPGDDEAVAALCRAMADAESRGLYEEALGILAALVEVLPPGDPRWLRVLDVMDWQSEWVLSHLAEGDADTAITAMQRIEQQLEDSEDLAARATVRFHMAAFLSFGAGRPDDAERAGSEAMALFAAVGAEEPMLLAKNELAWIRGSAGALEDQASLAQAVLADAGAGGHTRAAVQASGTAAYALGFLGRWDDAEALYEHSLGSAEALENGYRVAWALAQRGCMRGLSGRLEEATASVEAALAHDLRAPDAIAYEDLAHCHWLAGRLDDAVEALEQSAVRRSIRGSRRRAWGAALSGRLHAELGRQGRARVALEQARATYAAQPFLVWGSWVPWTEAFITWHEDGPVAAIPGLEEVAEHLASIGAVAYEGLVLVELAEAGAEAGEVERCSKAAERLTVVATRSGGGLLPHLADLANAWSLLAVRDSDGATDTAQRAAHALSRGGYLLHAGTAHHVHGCALASTDRAAAVPVLQEAAEIFERCGAVWRRDRVTAVLTRLGSRGRRAVVAVQGPGALTAREREVAVLAVKGYTAREIGDELFIGRRTVETHLASSYAKLAVRGKGELIRRAEEFGLAASSRSVPGSVVTTEPHSEPQP